MIVACNHCGKKYRIDSDKLNALGSKTGIFKCSKCNNKVKFFRPPPKTVQPDFSFKNSVQPTPADRKFSLNKPSKSTKESPEISTQTEKPRICLRSKMTLLFVVFPVILILITDSLLILRMREVSSVLTDTSSKLLTQSGEKVIIEKARAVAREVSLYLFMYPNLNKEHFNNYPEFKDLALQKVGNTGYTYMLSKPTTSQPSKIWVHPREDLIGTNATESMRKIIREDFTSWKKIHDDAMESGKEVSGYYFEENDRKKYMMMVPVEGSDLYIVSTTYIDEFTQPVVEVQETARQMTTNTLKSAAIMLFATIVLIGTIAYFYGNSISKRILSLTNITDQISVGDLDAQIPKYSRDEIGMLAEGIRRMQDSLRLSLERLRKRAS